MREYKIDDLALIFGALTNLRRDLDTSDQLGKPICTDRTLDNLSASLEGLLICCNNFDADPAVLNQIISFRQEILKKKVDRREAVLGARLEAILEAVQHNLGLRKFMYIPADQALYWNNFWFGDAFLFLSTHTAKVELQELGNCIVAGRWTACVFHSMRVAEYGLRKLAQTLRVKIVDKDKVCKIEYGDWNKVIVAIRGKIAKARLRHAGPKREKELQFFSDMADHCEYMKDIWRNEMAHTRRFYDKTEAFGVINRVREFTQRLAEHSAEREVKRVRKLRSNDGDIAQGSPP